MSKVPRSLGLGVLLMVDMWTDSCQQDVLNQSAVQARMYPSVTLGPSLIGGQLIPYHCFVVLFVTMGIGDITGVDTGSPANNTTVYLCL